MDPFERERMIVVPNTFKEIDRRVTFADPLKFSDHTKKLFEVSIDEQAGSL